MDTQVAILGVALLQWTVIVAISFVAARRVPRMLMVSTLLLAIAFVITFGVRRGSAALTAAALPAHSEVGSCASLEVGMTAEAARAKLGKPQEIRDDAKTRGPGAATWVYRDSRCAVHVLDEKVELID
jgi:uncharacterized protein with LGFP repeats